MAIIKSVKNSHSSIGHIINYVTKKEKTIGKKLCSGHNCNVDVAGKEMMMTKRLWGKEGGRTYKHFVQSFPPEEEITAEHAHELAMEYVERCPLFSDFEVLICTHVDKEHIHTHFVVNSVSFVDGHKFQMSKKDLEDMKILNNNICLEHGFSTCEIGRKKPEREGIIAYDTNKYQFLKKAREGKVKSFVQDTAVTVQDAMNESSSREDFIKAMEKKGYSVDWQDSHKYIVFTNAEGKKVRNSNLQKTYNMSVSKDDLIEFFREKSLQKGHPSRQRGR
ncbi:MAG: relaxase/mobilization nuclease domain-containing protein [Lachnoclostridium sp.]|nr:relaxase/mobilization nuclease domain-containing protein [Lachnospira sp.]MCM1248011.1 relaxase/mobilization nuclease domain-containing protein [Lachnoclostridium sp.]